MLFADMRCCLAIDLVDCDRGKVRSDLKNICCPCSKVIAELRIQSHIQPLFKKPQFIL